MKRQLVSAGEVAISLAGEQRRDLLVNVRPKGLKKYIEFMSTHYVTNDTDTPLELLVFKKVNQRGTIPIHV